MVCFEKKKRAPGDARYVSVVLVRCRARKERANERARDENRRRRLAAAQRRRKRSQRNFFPTQKQIKIAAISHHQIRFERKQKETSDALFLFDLRLVQSHDRVRAVRPAVDAVLFLQQRFIFRLGRVDGSRSER